MALATKNDERTIRQLTTATYTDNDYVLSGMIQELLWSKDFDRAESFMRKWLDGRAESRGQEYPGPAQGARAAA